MIRPVATALNPRSCPVQPTPRTSRSLENTDVPAGVSPGVQVNEPSLAAFFSSSGVVFEPFPNASFDIVTMFDLLEHVEDDDDAAREALRVLRPGGWILVSTPNRKRWRYPYYRIFRPIARDETELFAEWGHVRRGYTLAELEALFRRRAECRTAFINPLLAFSHDVSFSQLGRRKRLALHALLAPLSFVGWIVHGPDTPGTEIAAAWRIP